MLKPRTATILRVLVQEYISSATPVASDDVARHPRLRVSSATVRHEMAELEEEGYIRRPHVSSGGVPSDKGYRYYVQSLEGAPVPPVGVQRSIRARFGPIQRDIEASVQLAATILSQMSGNMAIVTSPRAEAAKLRDIQLVYIQEFLALLVVILQEARLRRHLVPLDGPTTQAELNDIATKLNECLSGLTHPEIDARLLELSPLEELVRDDTVAMMKEMDTEAALEHSVDGLRLLLGQPEFAEAQRATEIVGILEERVLLKSLLSEVPQEGGMAVFIGEENQEAALRPFSVIVSQYGVAENASGTIGVVGPTRMEYGSVMGWVRFLSSFMSQLMTGSQGRT